MRNPTPWHYKDDGFLGCIKGADGKFIFGGEPCEGRIEPDDANMLFAIRVVNSHEALLEALKTSYQYYNQIANTPDADGYVVAPDSLTRVILRKMREAIAQAEGK